MDTTLAQQAFDGKYISSKEICEKMKMTRAAVHFRRKKGKLPGAISIDGIALFLWEREQIGPWLEMWAKERGNA